MWRIFVTPVSFLPSFVFIFVLDFLFVYSLKLFQTKPIPVWPLFPRNNDENKQKTSSQKEKNRNNRTYVYDGYSWSEINKITACTKVSTLSLALSLDSAVLILLCLVHVHLHCSTLALTHVSLHTLIFHHSCEVFHLESSELRTWLSPTSNFSILLISRYFSGFSWFLFFDHRF